MSRRDRAVTTSDFVVCRTLGHAWDPIPAEAPAPYGDPFWLRCVRCTTVRMDFCTFGTGDVIGRRYAYPDGYQYVGDHDGDVAPTRQDYRRILFAEHLTKVRHLRAVRSSSS